MRNNIGDTAPHGMRRRRPKSHGSPIVIMLYTDSKKIFKEERSKNQYAPKPLYIFDYAKNMYGKGSGTNVIDNIMPKQEKKLQEWAKKKEKTANPYLAFGYWMTAQGTLTSSKNVATNSQPLFRPSLDPQNQASGAAEEGASTAEEGATGAAEEGASGAAEEDDDWLKKLEKEHPIDTMKGWTIWTDFVGEKMSTSDIIDFNLNNRDGSGSAGDANVVEEPATEGANYWIRYWRERGVGAAGEDEDAEESASGEHPSDIVI